MRVLGLSVIMRNIESMLDESLWPSLEKRQERWQIDQEEESMPNWFYRQEIDSQLAHVQIQHCCATYAKQYHLQYISQRR